MLISQIIFLNSFSSKTYCSVFTFEINQYLSVNQKLNQDLIVFLFLILVKIIRGIFLSKAQYLGIYQKVSPEMNDVCIFSWILSLFK